LFKLRKEAGTKTQAEAEKVWPQKGAAWRVQRVEKGTQQRYPYPPFTTDSMQQAASSKLGFHPADHQVAQGFTRASNWVKAKDRLDYMHRCVAVASEAQQAARAVVTKFFGETYLPPKPPVYQTRDKTAQEAHEAIRPVDPWKTPKAVEPYLTPQQYRLYRLIWRRFIASQMKPALYDTMTVDIATLIQASPTIYLFRATGSTLRFAGFLKVYEVDADAEAMRRGEDEAKRRRYEAGEESVTRKTQHATLEEESEGIENEVMPELVAGDALNLHQLVPKQHFTQPPQRYTEAQLIGALKKLGLGRPSTYATIVGIEGAEYVDLEQKRLCPTPLGFQVCELLEKHIQMVVDVGFTAQMEEDLDRIARGEIDRLTVMREFYLPFKATVDQALVGAAAERKPAARVVKATKRRGGEEATRSGRGGKSKSLPRSEKEGQTCPQCHEGMLVIKSGKFGAFLGCSRYSQGCRYTETFLALASPKNAGRRKDEVNITVHRPGLIGELPQR
jgi:DNA topoisomerase-1